MSHDQPHPDDERVSDLLADARHTEPLPAEVAARLDRTLQGLVEERVAPATVGDRVAPVVDLAARRRRRWTAGLVAAAAVVALAVSLPRLDLTRSSSDAGSADTAEAPAAASERESDSQARELASSGAESGDGSTAGDAAEPSAPLAAAPVEVRPEHFKQDVATARSQASSDAAAVTDLCGVVPPGADEVVAVRYADREGYLVFSSPEGDRQGVALYLCPDGALARQVVVPAP